MRIIGFSISSLKKIRDCYENNALTTNGNGNTQIMGNSNQVNTHAK